jgi:hypothetical protein
LIKRQHLRQHRRRKQSPIHFELPISF